MSMNVAAGHQPDARGPIVLYTRTECISENRPNPPKRGSEQLEMMYSNLPRGRQQYTTPSCSSPQLEGNGQFNTYNVLASLEPRCISTLHGRLNELPTTKDEEKPGTLPLLRHQRRSAPEGALEMRHLIHHQ